MSEELSRRAAMAMLGGAPAGARLDASPDEKLSRAALSSGRALGSSNAKRHYPTLATLSGSEVPSVAEGGPVVIEVGGRALEADCPPFRLKRVAPSPKPWDRYATTTSKDGQKWEMLVDGDQVWFSQFGGSNDDTRDNADVWDACKAFVLSSNPYNPPTICFVGAFRFSRPMALKGGTFRLLGLYTGESGSTKPRSALIFTSNDGIIIDARSTKGGTYDQNESSGDAGGTLIQGLLVWHPGEPVAGYGVFARTRCVLKDLEVVGFGAANVFIFGNAAGGNGGNANNWIMEHVTSRFSNGYGIWIMGSDANAGTGIALSCMYNAKGGLREESFLGNTYVGLHFELNNGFGVGGGKRAAEQGAVWYDGMVYVCIVGREAQASNTVPGHDNSTWEWFYASESRPSFIREWKQGERYTAIGSIVTTNVNARNFFSGVYVEGGELPSQITGRSVVTDGGCRDMGFYTRASTGVVEKDNRRERGGFVSIKPDGGTTDHVELTVNAGGGGDASHGQGIIEWYRSLPGIEPTSYWGVRSLKDDRYVLTAVRNNTLPSDQYGTAYFGKPASPVDYNHPNSGNQLALAFHVFNLWIGRPQFARRLTSESAMPTSGDWGKNDLVLNDNPAPGMPIGWVCLRGTNDPGGLLFKGFGLIAD